MSTEDPSIAMTRTNSDMTLALGQLDTEKKVVTVCGHTFEDFTVKKGDSVLENSKIKNSDLKVISNKLTIIAENVLGKNPSREQLTQLLFNATQRKATKISGEELPLKGETEEEKTQASVENIAAFEAIERIINVYCTAVLGESPFDDSVSNKDLTEEYKNGQAYTFGEENFTFQDGKWYDSKGNIWDEKDGWYSEDVGGVRYWLQSDGSYMDESGDSYNWSKEKQQFEQLDEEQPPPPPPGDGFEGAGDGDGDGNGTDNVDTGTPPPTKSENLADQISEEVKNKDKKIQEEKNDPRGEGVQASNNPNSTGKTEEKKADDLKEKNAQKRCEVENQIWERDKDGKLGELKKPVPSWVTIQSQYQVLDIENQSMLLPVILGDPGLDYPFKNNAYEKSKPIVKNEFKRPVDRRVPKN